MTPHQSLEDLMLMLAELLTQERADLIAGEFANLHDFAEAKQTYLLQIEERLAKPDAKRLFTTHVNTIKTMQRRATENEQILLAMQQGVKSAQDRITHLGAIENAVGTYTEGGGRLHLQYSAFTCKKIA